VYDRVAQIVFAERKPFAFYPHRAAPARKNNRAFGKFGDLFHVLKVPATAVEYGVLHAGSIFLPPEYSFDFRKQSHIFYCMRFPHKIKLSHPNTLIGYRFLLKKAVRYKTGGFADCKRQIMLL
jgi:hypothetical protein